MAKYERPGKHDIRREVSGVLFIAFTILMVASLSSYNPSDVGSSAMPSGSVQNLAGITGAYLAVLLIHAFGSSAHTIPVMTLALGILLFRKDSKKHAGALVAGGFLFMVSTCILLYVFWTYDPIYKHLPGGGLTGKLLAEMILVKILAKPGAGIFGFTILFLSILVATRMSVREFLEVSTRVTKGACFYMYDRLKRVIDGASQSGSRIAARVEGKIASAEKPVIASPLGDASGAASGDAPGGALDTKIIKKSPKQKETADEEFRAAQVPLDFPGNEGDYILPSVELLKKQPKISREKSDSELIANSDILTKKLADFGIEGRVTMVLPGPVITLYEFEPAAGIKVSRIANLADDLAMGLRAVSVRILAPVPGKAVVGIEVPNSRTEPGGVREIIESVEFAEKESMLTMVLGKDTSGVPVVTDLAGIPHLLIAGATGSGKSVGLNAMIISILYKATPVEVNFIMIDPKMLELSIYDGIPHLISPVVTNPKKAANALKWAVEEMERRYQLLAGVGFRNITGYNKWVEEFLKEREEEKRSKKKKEEKPVTTEFDENGPIEKVEEEIKPLPYIVIVIDELADLMMVASKEVEMSLARLAQMARASGIHLIVATQRPSVDVLTGLIKANFPARISYQVSSRIDSRTILDSIGAEKLLGKGDMLFLPPGTSRLQRIHGPFVADEEVKKTVAFLKKQGKPMYNEEILKSHERIEEGLSADVDDDDDEYFEQAVELVTRSRQASISMIQRRLRIGYNRAARIIETMESKGMVGPADGAKPREVLIPSLANDEEF
jgi:S-DNA-T family DNA segregation ATPase FtsK/SpoIIIE